MSLYTLNNWEIVNDNCYQYIEGYRENSENIYETSNIVMKIPLRDYLLVITENETLYRLPYSECYTSY